MRGPSIVGDIYQIPYPGSGDGPSPINPGNFGLSGPGTSSIPWQPTGTGGPLGKVANFLNRGIPSSDHGHVTLKSHDFVQHQYLLPPTSDGASRKLMRGMLTFAIREMDKDDNSTMIYSLSMINQLARDQWNDFVLDTSPTSAYYDAEKRQFLEWMKKYGDNGLINYDKYVRSGSKGQYGKDATTMSELAQFHTMAIQDGYCYLTLYGFLRKVNWHGCVMNTNQSEGIHMYDDTDSYMHYVQANVGLAKRMLVGQCFGSSDEITTGSKTWITLTRQLCGGSGQYGCFVLTPGGSKMDVRPRHLAYVDESGARVTGHFWYVGTVIEPANWSPQKGSIDAANNVGSHTDANDALNAFGGLPTCYVAMGFNN
jgi:hypothetical protein